MRIFDVVRIEEDKVSKRITGSVYWIGNGRLTTTVVDAKAAFSDPDQANEQVFYAETCADAHQQKIARLAYSQYQGKPFRGSKPSITTVAHQREL